MAVNKKSAPSKSKNEEDDIRLDVDAWDVSFSYTFCLKIHFYPFNELI